MSLYETITAHIDLNPDQKNSLDNWWRDGGSEQSLVMASMKNRLKTPINKMAIAKLDILYVINLSSLL